MSIENRESVGNFKTPEELAKALYKKSKNNLADRIIALGIEAKNNSKSARDALKSGLSHAERTEITQTLPDKGLEVDLGVTSNKPEKKDPATEAGKAAIASAIGEDNAEKLEKGMSFFDKVSTGFDKIGDIFEQKGFIAGIGAIFIMFKGIFSGDFSALDGILGENKGKDKDGDDALESEDEGNSNLDLNKIKDPKYSLGVKVLFLLKGNKKNNSTQSILDIEEIKTSNFEKLETIYDKYKTVVKDTRNAKGISEELGIKDKAKDNQLYNAIGLLVKNKKTIETVLGKDDKDWKTKPLKDLISNLSLHGDALLKAEQKISNLDFSFNPIDNIKKLADLDLFSLSIDKTDFSFGDLETRSSGILSQVSKTTLFNLFSTFSSEPIKVSDSQQKNRLIDKTDKTDKEKLFIDNLLKFEENIIITLSSLFGNNNKDKYLKYYRENGINFKKLIELYIITGGKTDLSEMNSFQKSEIYLKGFSLMGNDKSLRGETFDTDLINAVKDESDIIPKDVKIILSNLMGKALDGIIESMSKTAKELFGVLKNYPEVYIPVILAIGLFIYAGGLRVVVSKGIGFLAGISSLGLGIMIYNVLSPEKRAEFKIKSPDDVDKILKDSLG